MKNCILLFLILLGSTSIAEEIKPVEVTDQTIKVGVGQTEDLYFGFAEGDIIVFSFEETKGKPLKEIDITELPSSSKFSDFKTSNVQNKRIKVNKKGVYKFSFHNGAIVPRICKIHIQRIPASEDLVSFNTGWEWKTLYDTTYVPYTEDSVVGYDTTYYWVTKQRLKSDELVLEDVLINHGVKVHSRYYKYDPLAGNKGQYNESLVKIELPAEKNSKYVKRENLTWYYGLGVNQQLKKEVQKNKTDILNLAGDISAMLGRPEFKVAFKLLNALTNDNSDLAIATGLFSDYTNALKFMNDDVTSRAIRWDNIVSSTSIRMNNPLKGTVYLGLENENGTTALTGGSRPVTVYVNVSVWTRVRKYEDYQEQKFKVEERKVTLNKTRVVVNTSQVRVNTK